MWCDVGEIEYSEPMVSECVSVERWIGELKDKNICQN